MHSFGYRIIRENAGLFEPFRFCIIQSDQTKAILMGDAAQLAGFKRSHAKEAIKCRQRGDCIPIGSREYRICDKYISHSCRVCNAIDYDDQIILACRLLKERANIAVTYRTKATRLLV